MRINTWFEALNNCHTQGLSYVLITVITTAGSTPREAGCKMLVTSAEQFDTIGGGHLEFDAVNKAREYLIAGVHAQNIVSYPLSSKLGQCCGGAVKVLFEVYVNYYQRIAIFGAGHVAKALVPILAQLPLQIDWIDSREELFQVKQLAQNINCLISDEPADEIVSLPSDTWVIILTHNHQLDYALVEACLKNKNISFIGMIGSETKAKRFRNRLAHRGYSDAQILTLSSPIGEPIIPGKRPIEVAVSISAQLIQKLHKVSSYSSHKKTSIAILKDTQELTS
ncbi:xanthine dehydrogenase accessory protein XdhC [Brumicola pallidula]|uniref:Xanthine dehydrogenase accessory factor n=1 Tax=Brumicola pallidula DSM 14239 = ACAM 615 TaxID=1121922 RepID=K6ZVZ9_9ALTE|nr:xanthine dehydrogenase accessory protein XdhC [Glaciecola pallidula]GAC27500.1 xanthine dehydrogenase accessory factor [Glaciecola pallidula DSM 14239 = ACAM 615]